MKCLSLLLVPLVVLVLAPFAPAKRAPSPNPIQRALQAEVVVVGKVSAIEKETVDAAEAPGTPKVAHKIAVIKVESALSGAANLTHVKIGFVPADPNAPRRSGPAPTALVEGQEALFFLAKHPSGLFYTFNWMSSPVDATADNFKSVIASVKKALEVVADPMKAFKAEKAEDRAFAATVLLIKNRTSPTTSGEIGIEKMTAEESHRLLKAFADADWTKYDPNLPAPTSVFYMLGLTTVDGWAAPKAQPGTDFNVAIHKAFSTWVDGAGKDYRINRFVVKVAGK